MLGAFDWETEPSRRNRLGEVLRSLLDTLSLRCCEIPEEMSSWQWDLTLRGEARAGGRKGGHHRDGKGSPGVGEAEWGEGALRWGGRATGSPLPPWEIHCQGKGLR